MDRARNGMKAKNFNSSGGGIPSLSIWLRDLFLSFLVGFFMGIANLIPGVSGGTVALMTGVFERLINALANLSFKNFSNLFKGKFFRELRYYNFDFLIILIMGAALSIVFGSKPMNFLLINHQTPTMVFFSGLIFGSLPIVNSNIERKSRLLYSLLGFALVIVLNMFENDYNEVRTMGNNFFLLIISGALSMCAMILPGVSGAFILVLLGQYEKVIDAINKLEIKTLVIFGVGALIGVILFSRFLRMIFSKHKDAILGFFFGTMVAAAIFLPQKGPLSFIIPPGNLIFLSIGFFIALMFSLYEIRNKI